MPRKHVRKTLHGNFCAADMEKAVENVLQNHQSIRYSSKIYNVDWTTLSRYVKEAKEKETLYINFKKSFTTTQVRNWQIAC